MNRTSSYINADAAVPNTGAHHKADKEYVPAMLHLNGVLVPALFTHEQIRTAAERAAKNPEDAPVGAWGSVPEFLRSLESN